ncbi:MAG: hypothetical protein ACFCU6_14530 [Balneolaceae bacterium]
MKKKRKVLSDNRYISIEELRLRKDKLKKDISGIESSLDQSFTKLKNNTIGSFDILSKIKKKPFKSVGTALIMGLVIGLAGRKKSRKRENRAPRYGFNNMIMDELKRMAARKATEYITHIVDSEVVPRIRKKDEKRENVKTNNDS